MGLGQPTGIVFNGTSDFVVSNGTKSGPARFIFATLDGTIAGWNPAVSAASAVTVTSAGVAFTGLAMGSNANGNFLFAADFGAGNIDVFDAKFNLVSQFSDPNIPSPFAPFGIQNISGNLYVTFATTLESGPNGFVDVFDTSANLLQQLVADSTNNGPLNVPWGLALAPSDFGAFSNALLVGNSNLPDGRINAFDPSTGAWLGVLTDKSGNPLSIGHRQTRTVSWACTEQVAGRACRP
jgi:uncharacterized protein (TIGR03118 family)